VNTNCEAAESSSGEKEDDYPWNEVTNKRVKIIEALNKRDIDNQNDYNERN
jgi:hypothetical protein